MAEFDAERIGPAVVLRQLAAVIDVDPVARELERVERHCIAGPGRGLQFGWRDAQASGLDVDAIELVRQLDQRFIAARRHIRDDRAHRLLDIGGGLALGVQKRAEFLGEIRRRGRRGGSAWRHSLSLP